MSIALPVHLPGPTFTPGSTIAGSFISKSTVHLLHNKHRALSLYETDAAGTVQKVQEFLTKGTRSIHLIAAKNAQRLDAFVMVGDLVDWCSMQAKGVDAIHDFVCLESQEHLMRFSRTVPYIFACFNPVSKELAEQRRFYFAEDNAPAIMTHNLADGTEICAIGTSRGLIGTLSLQSPKFDRYYKVGGSQNTTYEYASLSNSHVLVQATLNDDCSFYFLRFDASGALSLVGTYESQQMPLGAGPLPDPECNIACIWFKTEVIFVDPEAAGGPKRVGSLQLPLSLASARYAPQLSEDGVETYLTSSHLARLRGVYELEIVDAPRTGVQIGGGSLYFHNNDLVRLNKYADTSSPGWIVRSRDYSTRNEFPFAYEFETISNRGCEPAKKEFSSWSHHFTPSLGSSFLTTKDAATYAVCRKSGLCSDKINEVLQLWLYENVIIASTETQTVAFGYEGTPRLDLKPRPLFSAMDAARTFAFRDGVQVTATHINSIGPDTSITIPSQCMPVVDATIVDKSHVVVASSFSTFSIVDGLIAKEKTFDEPVMKVIANGGTIATLTLQQLHIEREIGSKTIYFSDRLSDVVVTNGHVISSTFNGSVYLDSEQLGQVTMNCVPVKLIVAGHKVLAVTEVDAMIVDTSTLTTHSALALSGVNGGFAWDDKSFAALKNGNMWVCDLNKIGQNLQRTSPMLIGPIKTDATSSPQWSWGEKLACTNSITSNRFDHEITDVCPVHPLQHEHLKDFDGLIKAIELKAYISSFETLYLWADFNDFDLFKRLTAVQKRLETWDHTFGGHKEPKWLEWRGFIDGELLYVALRNSNLDWLFEDEGVDAEALRTAFQQVSF